MLLWKPSQSPTQADLYPLHLQEGGHLKSLLPDEQLAVQLHAEEQVLPRLRLDAEAVLPLVQQVVVLAAEGAQSQQCSLAAAVNSIQLEEVFLNAAGVLTRSIKLRGTTQLTTSEMRTFNGRVRECAGYKSA